MNNLIYKLTVTFPLRQKRDGVYYPTKIYYSNNPEYVTDLLMRFNWKIMKTSYPNVIEKVEMTTDFVSFNDRQRFEKQNGWVKVGSVTDTAEVVINHELLDYGNKSTVSEFVNKVALKYSREVKVRINKRDTVKIYWYTKLLGKRLPYSFYGRHSAFPLNDIK